MTATKWMSTSNDILVGPLWCCPCCCVYPVSGGRIGCRLVLVLPLDSVCCLLVAVVQIIMYVVTRCVHRVCKGKGCSILNAVPESIECRGVLQNTRPKHLLYFIHSR